MVFGGFPHLLGAFFVSQSATAAPTDTLGLGDDVRAAEADKVFGTSSGSADGAGLQARVCSAALASQCTPVAQGTSSSLFACADASVSHAPTSCVHACPASARARVQASPEG